MPVESVGAVVKADGNVAEIFIAPSLVNYGMSFTNSVRNQIKGMILADTNLLQGLFLQEFPGLPFPVLLDFDGDSFDDFLH